MIKTLLLCFIHGFKGDEETFFTFPEDLQTAIQSQSPDLDVQTAIYPKYETRGDLAFCVEIFKEWLQEQVTERENKEINKNAVREPSVGVVLVAHSMGGFVATDTLFSILTNRPKIEGKEYMFPNVCGLLTFDTPFNGLARSLFAYGAFSQYQNVTALWNIWSSLTSGLGLSAASQVAASIASSKTPQEVQKVRRAIGGVPTSSWKRWGILAARTGTVGAVLAGGVTAYVHREEIGEAWKNADFKNIKYKEYFKKENLPAISIPRTMPSLPQSMSFQNGKDVMARNLPANLSFGLDGREKIGEGFAWMAGHLKFVGVLMKQEGLSGRLQRLEHIKGVGKCNVFTDLGENGVWSGGYFVPRRRFCAVPANLDPELIKEKEAGEESWWVKNVNGKAENEIMAHCSMFQKERNDGYELLLEMARGKCVGWVATAGIREVVDGFVEDKVRAVRSRQESEVLDDDGMIKDAVEQAERSGAGKRKPSAMETGIPEVLEEKTEQENEDELQLRAILSHQKLPQPEDGGISEEDLKQAMDIPLPVGDEDVKVIEEAPLPDLGDETSEINEKVGSDILKVAVGVPLPTE